MNDKEIAIIDISVVLPVYNEQENIEEMHRQLSETLQRTDQPYEIIFVDDGSNDATLTKLRTIAERDPNVVVVRFRRNFGQTAAMSAGFDYARGEIIITMDADLQNDPADIPKLIDKLEQGYDLVSGWRYQRQDGFLFRRLPSILANKIISYTTDVKLHDYGCSLKAFRRDVAKNLNLYGEMHRFIPAIASWMGVSIAEIKVNHRPRTAGQSKYGISRTSRVILDLLTVKFLLSYSSKPLQFFGLFGLVFGFIGLAISAYLVVQKLFFEMSLSDRPLLLFGVLLIFAGLQFLTMGLLAELQTRTYHEAQNKPIYVVREVIEGQKH